MSQIEIIEEREDSGHWRFGIQVLADDGTLHRRTMTLAWSDYNLWSPAGTDAPEAVAIAVFRCLLRDRTPDDLPARFDASLARRVAADADAAVPALITPA